MSPVKIKICGVTNAGDAEMIENVWAIGVIMHHFSTRSTSLKAAREIVQAAGSGIEVCGVFQDQPLDRVLRLSEEAGFSMLQFHGQESGEYCRAAKRLSGLEIIKARAIRGDDDVWRLFSVSADHHLADAPKRSKDPFNWSLLAGRPEPVIIAGSINEVNIQEAIKTARPWAIDIARASERSVGRKNIAAINRLVRAAQLD